MAMKEQSYVRQSGYACANLGKELALLDMKSGAYIGFNATAAHVWRLLEQPHTVEALVCALLREFEVEEEPCRSEVRILLDRLLARGLIRLQND